MRRGNSALDWTKNPLSLSKKTSGSRSTKLNLKTLSLIFKPSSIRLKSPLNGKRKNKNGKSNKYKTIN